MNEAEASALIGPNDRNLQTLSLCCDREISFRDNTFFVSDCSEETASVIRKVLTSMHRLTSQGKTVSSQDIIYAYRLYSRGENIDYEEMQSLLVGRTLSGKPVYPRPPCEFPTGIDILFILLFVLWIIFVWYLLTHNEFLPISHSRMFLV